MPALELASCSHPDCAISGTYQQRPLALACFCHWDSSVVADSVDARLPHASACTTRNVKRVPLQT
jgi:hypothetical protein